MTNIRAAEVPEIRAEIITWLDNATAAQLWTKLAAGGHYDWLGIQASSKPAEASSILRGMEILRQQNATLFYIAADMVELVDVAASSIPDFELAPEDLPADAGVMIFQRPISLISIGDAQLGITAVCWGPTPAHDNVLFGTTYLDRAEAAPVFDSVAPNRQMARNEPQLVYAHGGEFTWPFGNNESTALESANFKATLLPRLRTAWLLMQQSLVNSSEVQLTRPARRRLQRAGHEPADVRLVELRRTSTPAHTDDSTTDREYHHRWIVRGHWRQQWHPSRQVHRPTWIAPHIKGPDQAPLIGGEKVNVWKR
jgi:hypothetical protein